VTKEKGFITVTPGGDKFSEGRQDDGVHERVDAAVDLHQAAAYPAVVDIINILKEQLAAAEK
jgi:hypothetical protein